MPPDAPRPGPPPLRPFGLILHHDASWSHEGEPVLNRKLRKAFDQSVRYLMDEKKYVVQLGRFRGEIEIEETGFFVRLFDPETGAIALSDGTREILEIASLAPSPIDGALLCTVKRDLIPEGLPARFMHAAHAELMNAVDPDAAPPALRLAGRLEILPEL
ncbi:MAG: hypothetical protein HRU01_01380 [Myxococcales bacterium]|nr:hypothetical protein [Myxococcales bacterium]